jgi:Carboxypeptidase regulatory-like domain
LYASRWIIVFNVVALVAVASSSLARAQEPSAPASAPSSSPSTSVSSSKASKKKYSHANDFLIRGTVFSERALSFPGVQLRIRRAGEKKFHWESYTNSRGEFAVRVPQGSDYELVVRAKGFAEQTRAIDAKSGDYEGNLVFRLQPEGGGQK